MLPGFVSYSWPGEFQHHSIGADAAGSVAHDIRGACMELSKWIYVKERIIKGLAVRRIKGDAVNLSERALCLREL